MQILARRVQPAPTDWASYEQVGHELQMTSDEGVPAPAWARDLIVQALSNREISGTLTLSPAPGNYAEIWAYITSEFIP